MARIDKAWVVVRGTAGTALTGTKGVAVNSGGSVVPAGSANCIGVICLPGTIAAGRVVDILLRGEIVEYGGSAGASVFAGSNSGSLSNSSATGSTAVGFTIEGDRLVVAL
jgi:hypothetical protein